MKNYVSPNVEFQRIQLNEKVADKCWGYLGSGTGTDYIYYDTDGPGYVKFTITLKPGEKYNCSGSLAGTNLSITYVGPQQDKATEIENKFKEDVLDKITNGSPYGGEFYYSPLPWSK